MPTETPTSTPTDVPPGVVAVQVFQADGATLLAGACLSLTGGSSYSVCDNESLDADPSDGLIELDDVAPGEYDLTVEAPKDYESVGDVPPTLTVVSNEVAALTLMFQPRAVASPTPEPATGVLFFQMLLDDQTTPVEQVCIDLAGPATYHACDNEEGDQEPTGGIVEIDSVAAGDYTLTVTAPADVEAIDAPASISIAHDEFKQITLTFRALTQPATETPTAEATPTEEPTLEPPVNGVIAIQVLTEDGSPLTGLPCLVFTPAQGDEFRVCDNDDGDADQSPGFLELDTVAPGDYTITFEPLADYELVGEQSTAITLDPGGIASVSFTVRTTVVEAPTETPTPEPTTEATEEPTPEPVLGTLTIIKVEDAEGQPPLAGACFDATGPDGSTLNACDEDGDGIVRFDSVVAGEWLVHESQAPDGYAKADDQTVPVPEGGEGTATFVDQKLAPQIGSLSALAQEADDKPAAGACYLATGPDNAIVVGCDDDGDGKADLGQVSTGAWVVRQTTAPPGYDAPDPIEQSVTVEADQPAELTFTNTLTSPDRWQTPPLLQRPAAVNAVGDFQDELGCQADFDSTCGETALSENRGLWSGTFQMTPGNHSFRIVVASIGEESLGEGGVPGAPDLTVTVPDGSASVYIAYRPSTGEITARASRVLAQATSGSGPIDLEPREHGQFEGFFDAPAGTLDLQILFDGQPVAQDQFELDQDSRIHLVVEADGTIATVEVVSPASLTVTRTDANGGALTGSCVAVLTAKGVTIGQSCDADDGTADGVLTIAFPNGVQEGAYTLRETRAPDGAAPAPDQPVNLAAGENTAGIAV